LADDPNIPSTDRIYRRVPPNWIVFDENVGARRPSTAAFQDSSDGSAMSVHIQTLLAQNNLEPESALAGHPSFGLVSFFAGLARELGFGIAPDPQPNDPAHGLVEGKKTEGKRKRLRAAAAWVVLPDQANLTT
jgi:hypothetical protein